MKTKLHELNTRRTMERCKSFKVEMNEREKVDNDVKANKYYERQKRCIEI